MLKNVTKRGFPVEYGMEGRFEAIQANFEMIMEVLNGLAEKDSGCCKEVGEKRTKKGNRADK